MKVYTYGEILEKLSVLKEFFPTVRLVNPLACSIVNIEEKDGAYYFHYTGECFNVWEIHKQCANCTSARALQSCTRYSKCELLGNDIYHITSCPVNVEGTLLVLELVQPVNNNFCNSAEDNTYQNIAQNITATNSQLLHDTETPAYNRLYLTEHLPFFILNAHKSNTGNACMVQINHFHDVCSNFGTTAASGLVCTLYNLLKMSFDNEDENYIIRYNDNTFIVINTSLKHEDFKNIMQGIQSKALPAHILFNNSQIPFSINISFTDLFRDDIKNEASLLAALENNACK